MLAMRFLWEIKGERRDVMIECPAFDGGRLAEASFLADSMVPNKATGIRLHLSYSRGGFMGGPKDRFGGLGAFADMRCKISMEGLMEFAKKALMSFSQSLLRRMPAQMGRKCHSSTTCGVNTTLVMFPILRNSLPIISSMEIVAAIRSCMMLTMRRSMQHSEVIDGEI